MPGATVPSTPQDQQQSTAAGGVDIISQLITAARGADERSAKAAQAATVPISGGHIAPTQVNTPGAGHIYQQFAPDERRVVGKHNANMQGLANLSKSVANVVGQVTQMQDQKKTQALSVNIEHLMTAVASSDQAKQVLAQDPNNADAKAQLAKAEAIQNEVLGDDKNRKAIAKAYNINFTDPSKNNTPEHAAMKQAQDSYAKQFQDKMPSQMAPNQKAIAEAQTAAAEAKATHDLVDKLAPAIITAQSRENVAQTAAASREAAAKTAADQRMQSAKYTADQRLKGVLQGANIHVQGMLKAVDMRDKAMIEVAQKHLDAASGVNGNSPKIVQNLQKTFDSLGKNLMQYQQNINLLEQNRKNAEPSQRDGYDKQIQFFESQGKVLEVQQEAVAQKLAELEQTPLAGTAKTGETNAAGAATNYVSNPDDDSDDADSYDQ